MSWSDDEMKEVMFIGLSLAENQKIKEKNMKHWLKGFTMGLSVLAAYFTYDEFLEKWDKAND